MAEHPYGLLGRHDHWYEWSARPKLGSWTTAQSEWEPRSVSLRFVEEEVAKPSLSCDSSSARDRVFDAWRLAQASWSKLSSLPSFGKA